MKRAVLMLCVITGACSRGDDAKARRDAEQLKQDVKRGYERTNRAVTDGLEKAKQEASPAAHEAAQDIKHGYREADRQVTESLEKARQKVREGVRGK